MRHAHKEAQQEHQAAHPEYMAASVHTSCRQTGTFVHPLALCPTNNNRPDCYGVHYMRVHGRHGLGTSHGAPQMWHHPGVSPHLHTDQCLRVAMHFTANLVVAPVCLPNQIGRNWHNLNTKWSLDIGCSRRGRGVHKSRPSKIPRLLYTQCSWRSWASGRLSVGVWENPGSGGKPVWVSGEQVLVHVALCCGFCVLGSGG
jgi:hypothetical protein|mmetsp:Transcript_48044/g.80717  ORF Transcript_48044/g.80717 Transcript_48044/m.80717 type:complete len:200 (-) Transcript_48044:308-907(-)